MDNNTKSLILICATATAILPSVMAEYCVNKPQHSNSTYYYSSFNYANLPVSIGCYVKLFKPEPPELSYPYSQPLNTQFLSVTASGTASGSTVAFASRYTLS